jgi:surface polysaccharide O-acyltransferase-like enzyme
MSERFTGIDAFRLAAAVCVVALHVHYRDGLGQGTEVVIRLLCRWAVPFFFLVTGYFLERKVSDRLRTIRSLQRLAVIFVVSSILFVPMDLVAFGWTGTVSYCVRWEFLLRGTHFHLWFLSSMGVGLLFVLLCDLLGQKRLLAAGAAVCTIVALAGGAYAPVSESGVFLSRHLSSVVFMYAGMLLFRHKPGLSVSLRLLTLGILLQSAEALALSAFLGRDPANHQLSVGTVFFAIGVFGVSLNSGSQQPSIVANGGRLFSLGVYIIHPYCIWLCSGIFGWLRLPAVPKSIVLVPSVVLASILCLAFLRSYVKPLFLLIEGDVKVFRGIEPRSLACWARIPGTKVNG